MQCSHAYSDFMNELSALLCPAMAAKVQSFDLWRYVSMCVKGTEGETIWPFDFFFSGEVLINTDIGSALRRGMFSSSKWEIGNKC